jgi:addiction module HigA family antidote
MAENSADNSYAPDYATPPGEIFEEVLEDLGMTESAFAERCDMSSELVSRIINGRAPVTPETALRFEQVLGISASLWNSLEANYQRFEMRRRTQEKGEELLGMPGI